VLPFVKEGIAHGEKGLHIVDARLQYVRRLQAAGIDTAAADERGFDQKKMLALIEETLRAGPGAGVLVLI
jgi:hypothetical protein